MVANTTTQPLERLAEGQAQDYEAAANYCVAWRIRERGVWTREYFANRFEAHRRYLQVMTRATEVCLYVPTEIPTAPAASPELT
jgi:hypothetical protein